VKHITNKTISKIFKKRKKKISEIKKKMEEKKNERKQSNSIQSRFNMFRSDSNFEQIVVEPTNKMADFLLN
jgi:hypothetical protein